MQSVSPASSTANGGRAQLFKIDKSSHPQPVIRSQAKAAIKEIDNAISALLHHPLFDYLRQCARTGFTPEQFCVHGRGYLEACRQVIPLFEMAAQCAQTQGDLPLIKILQGNLDEERGLQDQSKAHTRLADYSHQTHAKQVFGIEAQRFEATPVNPAVSRYIERQRAIYDIERHRETYGAASYHAVIGACYVDEKGAVGMMAEYFNTFFLPYRDRYSSQALFDSVAEYWRDHTNELEAIHAKDIARALLANCTSDDHIDAMKGGCVLLLTEQKLLLDGVLTALRAAQHEGQPVTPTAMTVQVADLV